MPFHQGAKKHEQEPDTRKVTMTGLLKAPNGKGCGKIEEGSIEAPASRRSQTRATSSSLPSAAGRTEPPCDGFYFFGLAARFGRI